MSPDPDTSCLSIHVRGIVQGVGFRPFVYRLATDTGLSGWVRNTSEGVNIVVQGPRQSTAVFLRELRENAPPLAHIEEVTTEELPHQGFAQFEIRESLFEEGKSQLVSPDVATCSACLEELLDSTDRRHRYPFTNCTNCGPRFTIITDMPYDRPNTTMRSFTMCPACQAEYDDPLDRRFHAQPNACPSCGPSLSLLDAHGATVECVDPLARTSTLLKKGAIVAVKGLGGFLLACDATSPGAVRLLRDRKQRPAKPFAVMVSDLEIAAQHCDVSQQESSLLASPAAPIVLARWKDSSSICREVAPGLLYLGLMLPYTPLHHVLLRDCGVPLVMTSGNLSEEPIAAGNEEALRRLAGIADYFLVHNRPIHSRYDDSVAMVVDGTTQMLRRARGYAPTPVELSFEAPRILATGVQTKNTFCLTRGHHAFVSQHIGDLDSVETLDHFETTVQLYARLFRAEPELVAHDLHPDYLSTRYAQEMSQRGLKTCAVQHHHAHIAACMVENGVAGPVIGVAFDGAGLGADGRIWGGEFLVCDFTAFHRVGHIEYLPLAGGDAATLRPYRTAAGYILNLFGDSGMERSPVLLSQLGDTERHVIARQVATGLNAPLCSSMGRLFDAVAAIAGLRYRTSYEGQAAVELEMAAQRHTGPATTGRYVFQVDRTDDTYLVKVAPLLSAVLDDVRAGRPTSEVAAAFHEAVAQTTADMCGRIAADSGIRTVALSGGVFQNRLLLGRVRALLSEAGFHVLLHTMLPSNDGCVSLGQAVVAAHAT
jgi:hydrogenase maturation protein HypF